MDPQFHLSGRFDRESNTQARGVIQFGTGASKLILIPEPGGTSATCADADDDGVSGLVLLEVLARNVRTGEQFLVSLAPTGGDIDESGEYEVALRAGDMSTTVTTDSIWIDLGKPGIVRP